MFSNGVHVMTVLVIILTKVFIYKLFNRVILTPYPKPNPLGGYDTAY